jgi:uncharacterized protein (DUF1800 family)
MLAVACAALLTLLLCVPRMFAGGDTDPRSDAPVQLSKAFKGKLPITELTEDEAILHALNRLGYGPEPGEIERIRQMGLEKWIEQQLHPESIDDSALNERLAAFPTLKMSSRELLEKYPPPNEEAKREGLTLQQYQEQQKAKADEEMARLLASAADPAEIQLAKMQGPQRIIAELSMAKLDRAIYSQRQLEAVMDDFWFNHFNVYAEKGDDKWLITEYERDAIQPHAMGKFRDLLLATAKSPAMLFYLDNWLSADPIAVQQFAQRPRRYPVFVTGFPPPGSFPPGGFPPQQANGAGAKRPERGLNENYGREVMELHTLGVDGGYTQQDVIEMAKCMTGWTIRQPRRDPEYFFNDRLHTQGPKIVLGRKFDYDSEKDGSEALKMLASRPETAKFISTELARHFVSDTPPEAIIDRMAKTFVSSEGDTRAVLKTMIYSPEFWSREAYHAKVKTPFELVASTARALEADATVPIQLAQWVNRMGEPLYMSQPPTGYSDKAETWVNAGALLNRLNFAMAFTTGRVAGTTVDLGNLLGADSDADPKVALSRSVDVFLDGQAAPATESTLEQRLNDPQILQARLDDPVKHVNEGLIAGLVLGAPEFQRR